MSSLKASRADNAGAHDARRVTQSWLDMDAAGLEAGSAPVVSCETGSHAEEAENPQISPDQSGCSEG
jgi:hypothetical protein